jgi:hypothetical protein
MLPLPFRTSFSFNFSEFKGEKPHRVGIGIDEEF